VLPQASDPEGHLDPFEAKEWLSSPGGTRGNGHALQVNPAAQRVEENALDSDRTVERLRQRLLDLLSGHEGGIGAEREPARDNYAG
jgi:hypothetical protein